jgi:hypothetical protein
LATARFGFPVTANEEQFLLSACKLTDQLAVIEAAMTAQPPWVTGSMGQLVPNGMLAEIRQYNMLISQTLARIKIDFDSAANADLIINRPNPQRAGANKRWRGAGA